MTVPDKLDLLCSLLGPGRLGLLCMPLGPGRLGLLCMPLGPGRLGLHCMPLGPATASPWENCSNPTVRKAAPEGKLVPAKAFLKKQKALVTNIALHRIRYDPISKK
jgi:hypothetical protein